MNYDEPFAPDPGPQCCPCHCAGFRYCHRNQTSAEESRGIHDIRSIQRTIFLIWAYLLGEGVWDEALEYIREHSDEPTPLDIGMDVSGP